MFSLNIVFSVLAVCFTSVNTVSQICSDDPFIHSDVTKDGKEFLYPWDHSQRLGDWYYNKGFCRKYCSVMVEIMDEEENNEFNKFFREVGVQNPGVWLGAQIRDASPKFQWENYNETKTANYTNWQSGEPNEQGLSCLHMAWDTSKNNPWWNYYCNTKTMHIACERYVKPTTPANETSVA